VSGANQRSPPPILTKVGSPLIVNVEVDVVVKEVVVVIVVMTVGGLRWWWRRCCTICFQSRRRRRSMHAFTKNIHEKHSQQHECE